MFRRLKKLKRVKKLAGPLAGALIAYGGYKLGIPPEAQAWFIDATIGASGAAGAGLVYQLKNEE